MPYAAYTYCIPIIQLTVPINVTTFRHHNANGTAVKSDVLCRRYKVEDFPSLLHTLKRPAVKQKHFLPTVCHAKFHRLHEAPSSVT